MVSEVRVGVTGSDGFLGWHLRCRLLALGIATLSANREIFETPDQLDHFVRESDVIIHVAGINRASSDEEILVGNVAIAQALIDAMVRTERFRPVVYMNSVKVDEPGVYGTAKRASRDMLASFLGSKDKPFVDLILPHLFGEYGKPFYNSAVTTFAHQLVVGERPEINGDGSLELLHAQDVAQTVVNLASAESAGSKRLVGVKISVSDAWNLLEGQYLRYVREGTIPAFKNLFELRMFNMLRSQLDQAGFYPQPIVRHVDSRGAFTELARADGVGQTSISTSHRGVTRGDHFHFDKIERFVVVDGSARIRLRRLFTDEVRTFDVNGDAPMYIDMPPLVTHNISNTADRPMTTVFWAGDHFDPNHPDTHAEPVEVGE